MEREECLTLHAHWKQNNIIGGCNYAQKTEYHPLLSQKLWTTEQDLAEAGCLVTNHEHKDWQGQSKQIPLQGKLRLSQQNCDLNLGSIYHDIVLGNKVDLANFEARRGGLSSLYS
ncbi:hypothetical protein cyc_05279 [Cyclospora cayetanensis]|uniref:Uncharacterized protein n=1 Tax=Cyclospora cayetanensis TaxID=88456 RepID=A0A1D3D1A0_9EIME|nr:hypothetical protein cyc_05279 [Cyclospora cayetanensis]